MLSTFISALNSIVVTTSTVIQEGGNLISTSAKAGNDWMANKAIHIEVEKEALTSNKSLLLETKVREIKASIALREEQISNQLAQIKNTKLKERVLNDSVFDFIVTENNGVKSFNRK